MRPPDTAMRPGRLALWWLAIRPRTLTLSAVPVGVGTALALAEGAALAWAPLLVALASAMLIQAGTNLHNDFADFQRGNDGPARLGPARITAAGWATPEQVRRAAILSFAAAFAGGVYLAVAGGWPIVVIGVLSLAAGWAYSGGPRPLSHSAFGEVFVLAFFGLAAVAGSHYLQSGRLSRLALLAGIALGAHAAAVLLVNNVRDLEADCAAGRRTLAAWLGDRPARRLYALLMLAPFALLLPLMLELHAPSRLFVLLPALLPCLALARQFASLPRGRLMNRQLARTAQAQVLLGVLLGVALLV
ncbi:MAG: 1,4-dihydroxy-2-naphthoate polyprenyltransferase [Betaproteobacteria bacterium]|nr:1,4-dihydroxy-2-naphthoate polyprenyltransferase [Betaproteobacteria bacterium]